MRLLLDTTALYVAAGASDAALTPKVQRLLQDPETEPFISSLSITELAIKSNRGRSELSREDVEDIIEDLQVTVLPFEARHALRLFGLPAHHHDPFDRMLIATALAEDIPLVGSDREFRKYRGLRCIW